MRERMNKISTIYADYECIEHSRELAARHLSYAEYQAFPRMLEEVQTYGETRTFMKGLAGYFKRFGFVVRMDADKINYVIVA